MRLILLAAVLTVAGQTPPAAKPSYAYGGKPIVLDQECGSRQIEDLGLVCTEDEPCPIYLELSGIETAGSKVFLAGNFHTEAAILASLLLASEDEGRTYQEAHARLPNALLDQVQFVDFQTGFVSGNVAGSLAKDPFFLKTSDGGKTWRQLAVFEDGGFGVIGSFHFTSATQGTLTIEGPRGRGRYRRMETLTGGESWMTRELLDQPPAKERAARGSAAAGAPADWRVRGDSAAKALRVERRESGKWTTVTVFALRAGACKPDPPKPAEPEKDPPQP